MKTLIQFFEDCVEKYTDNIYLLEKKDNKYTGATYGEVKEKVYQFAAGLIQLGVNKGDRIALLAEGRNDWVISEIGMFYLGAVDVPLSIKLTEPSEIKFRLKHSGARFIIVSKSQAKKIHSLLKEIDAVEKIILLDPQDTYASHEIYFGHILQSGKEFLNTHEKAFTERWNSVEPDDYANICYTSGTTADPKGIILTHKNYLANIKQSLTLFSVPPDWTTLLFLPWDHAFAHTCGIYTLMACGSSMASLQLGETSIETLKNIPVNIREIRPHFLMSVPTTAKSFRKNIEKGIHDKGKLAESLFRLGLGIAYVYNGNGWDKGKGLKILLKPLNMLFDKILFSKVRQAFGGRLEFFIGGGALLDIDLQRFFYAIGIPMYQGYGLTEAAPVISANNPKKHKMGSSGPVALHMEIKICDDDGKEVPTGEKGEIVIRGDNVMAGYWKNPEATAETIREGWLYTGDMGYMDKDGFLYVLGRFKSLLIGDDGEKFSPEGIEEALIQQSKFIEQCMLYNNQNAYTTALIYPNVQAVRSWMAERNLQAGSSDFSREIIQLIEHQIDPFLKGGKYESMFPHRWLPSTFALITEGFTEENKQINSLMKMVRPKINEFYTDRIQYMYTAQGKNIHNEQNIKALQVLLA
ncbi:MAG: AMP-binding protein [Bacteroidales bacterium]|nr:AMP-binding protein [Bacteroidales bacterium]